VVFTVVGGPTGTSARLFFRTHQRRDGFFEWGAEFFQWPGEGFAGGFDGEGRGFDDFAEAGVGDASGFEEVEDFAGLGSEGDDDAGLRVVEEGDIGAGASSGQASAIGWSEVGWEGVD
jgi:hypothetical protein